MKKAGLRLGISITLVVGLLGWGAPARSVAAAEVLATLPMGAHPTGLAVNPETNLVYVSNSDTNDVSVIDGETSEVLASVPVGNGPRNVGVNPTTNRIYFGVMGEAN